MKKILSLALAFCLLFSLMVSAQADSWLDTAQSASAAGITVFAPADWKLVTDDQAIAFTSPDGNGRVSVMALPLSSIADDIAPEFVLESLIVGLMGEADGVDLGTREVCGVSFRHIQLKQGDLFADSLLRVDDTNVYMIGYVFDGGLTADEIFSAVRIEGAEAPEAALTDAGQADVSLVPHTLNALTMQLPASWTVTDQDEISLQLMSDDQTGVVNLTNIPASYFGLPYGTAEERLALYQAILEKSHDGENVFCTDVGFVTYQGVEYYAFDMSLSSGRDFRMLLIVTGDDLYMLNYCMPASGTPTADEFFSTITLDGISESAAAARR